MFTYLCHIKLSFLIKIHLMCYTFNVRVDDYMEKQRQIKILSIVALVLAISAMTLGFAAFSTTLSISSSASVTPSSADFAVKFSTSQTSLVTDAVAPSSKTTGITTTNGTIVNSVSPTLSNLSASFNIPGQYVEYTVYARNEGAYTAYLNNINYLGDKTCIASSGTTESLVQSACNSINVTVTIGSTTYDDTTPISSHALAKGASETIKVRLEYASTGTAVDGSFKITFPSISLVYSTVDDSSMDGKVVRVLSGDINTLGSVVAIGNEQFYVFGKENGNVKLLSMYNLRVGNKVTCDSLDFGDFEIETLTNATGIQDSDAKGALIDSTTWIGTTAFSNTSSTYSGSIVDGYVNSYKTYLTNMGADISSARLITKAELEKLGCNEDDYSCSDAPSWVYSTSYWSGSADDAYYVWCVVSDASFDLDNYSIDYGLGVRPVIEISESEF